MDFTVPGQRKASAGMFYIANRSNKSMVGRSLVRWFVCCFFVSLFLCSFVSLFRCFFVGFFVCLFVSNLVAYLVR